ncbi:PAS domain-containing sensor histidine kinase [Hyalangium gracile]|uniref:PAS domain-containing sensor histidine kinase n=1 Tax=Hyalangium gracile TaxID=394092 RepID=UPI001CCD757D|nr:ATP-binding protein [Hyalangium gracile]
MRPANRKHPGPLQEVLAELADPVGLLDGLFLHSPVPYSLFTADGHCLLTNPAYRAMFGREPPASYSVFEDEVLERLGVAALFRQAFQGETVETPVFWYDPKELGHVQVPDARRAAISCTCFPLKTQEGEIRHVVIAYKDVTAEWTVRDVEQERLKLVLKAGGLGHWELDLRTQRLTVSEGCKANFGLPSDADLSSYERLRACIHPEDRSAMEEAVGRSISRGEDYSAEYRVVTPEGGTRWVVARGQVVHAEDATPVGMMGVTVDITELKKTQRDREQLVKELGEERARLRAVLDNIPAGVLLAEAPTGRIVLGNAQVERILRHPVLHSPSVEEYGEWVGYHPDGRRVDGSEWPLARALRGETVPAERFLYQRGDGTQGWIRVEGAPIRHEGRITGGVIAFYDIQQERRAEERLRALADTSTALAQASTDFSTALEDLARLASESLGECCVLTLVDEERQVLDIVASYHPEPEARRLLKATMHDSYDNEGGPAMRVVRTGQPILLARVPQEGLLESLVPEARPFTERYGLHSVLIVPLRAQGAVIGTLGVSRGRADWPYTVEDQEFLQEMADRAGLAIQNVRLLKTAQQAVQLRDDFLSIASHELKTPLTPLSLKLQVMARLVSSEQGEELTQRLGRDLDGMRRQVRRLSDLISDLLDVARISGGRLRLELDQVDLASLVREVSARFEAEAERAGGRLQVYVEAPLVGRWDRLRLEQVVTNLLSNALKYGPGKPIHVRAELHGERARLTVRDEGIGIDAPHLARIFEKFERAVSDRHYGGLGLGLYITRQIVRALGGAIGVESELERGSTFTVELPLRGPEAPRP